MFYICKEMKRAIFNPEHDMCLADGSGSFIPPAAIVEFARKCRWIARFMGDGQVQDGAVQEGVYLTGGKLASEEGGMPVEESNGKITAVVPWGWNRCLRERLLKEGVPADLLPDNAQLDFIRESSRRELALELLEFLHNENGCSGGECSRGGEYTAGGDCPAVLDMSVDVDCAGASGGSFAGKGIQMIPAGYRIAARSMEEIEAFLQEKGRVVLKAPLSGSGKGVRFVTGELMETDRGWCRRTLQRQGAVIVEQRMNIIKEFAMLFEVTGGVQERTQEEMPQVREGVGVSEAVDVPQVLFRGYSLFYANNGAYKGNLLASNEYIEHQLAVYVPLVQLEKVRKGVERFLQEKLLGKYVGFVGVDQFVAESNGRQELSGRRYLWNPAMELNLRMTMGLVARNIYDFHKEEFRLGEGTHCFEPERGVFPVEGSLPCVE